MSGAAGNRAGEKLRIALVEPSLARLRALEALLRADAGVELCGIASTAIAALQSVLKCVPQLLVLDAALAQAGSPRLLDALRAADRTLPILLLCEGTRDGAAAAIALLEAGATDYLVRPDAASPAAAKELGAALLPLLRAHAGRRESEPAPKPALAKQSSKPVMPGSKRLAIRPLVQAVAIAVSTGGPEALQQLIPALPKTLRVPVFIAQHIRAEFAAPLAESLDRTSALRVQLGVPETRVAPGNVYVAPGDRHMLVERREHECYVVLDDGPPENSCKPAADPLFRSVAAAYGPGVLAVVMTGMGRDGLSGSELIRKAGGQVITQDAPSSRVWGMAGAVAEAKLADAIVPLSALAAKIARRVGGLGLR
jgi:two-component system chemotaxis response regulator CheB